MGISGYFMVKRLVDDANCLLHKLLLLLGDESHHTALS
jgi:hypothetical protein